MNEIAPLSGPRFLFYSHDGLGLGHVRRNLALASALTEAAPTASVLVAMASDEVVSEWLPPNVDTVKLPSLRKVANRRYVPRRLHVPSSDVGHLRAALLETAVRSFEPDVLVADKHPLGVAGELLPALAALREQGGSAVLGLRDILDDPVRVADEWGRDEIQDAIAEHYDRVLVFGHPSIVDPVSEYGLAPAVAARTRFCGYVINHAVEGAERTHLDSLPGGSRRPRVLATAGGGEDGFHLLRTFIAAARDAPWRGVVVGGPMAGEVSLARLSRLAEAAGVEYRRFVPDLTAWYDEVDAVVCMGGYNTLVEAVSRGARVVCVPRVRPRTEQLIRAAAFSSLGLLRFLDPDGLLPADLAAAVRTALTDSRRRVARAAHAQLDFNGARRAARHLLEQAEAPRRALALV